MNTDIIRAQAIKIWLREEHIFKKVLIYHLPIQCYMSAYCVSLDPTKKHLPHNIPVEQIILHSSLSRAGRWLSPIALSVCFNRSLCLHDTKAQSVQIHK